MNLSIVLTASFRSLQKKIRLPNQPFDYYLFFDVEATCEENTKNYPHEVIEFPVLLVDGKSFDIVSSPSYSIRYACHGILISFSDERLTNIDLM